MPATTPLSRPRLEQVRNPYTADSLSRAYAAVAARLNQADVKPEAAILRARLEQARDGEIASIFGDAYAAVAAKLDDPAHVKAAATLLRARLEQELEAIVVPATTPLPRSRLEQVPYESGHTRRLGQAYATVAARLDEAGLTAEAGVLRSRLEKEQDGRIVGGLALAYAAVAARLNEVADVKAAATFLRARMELAWYWGLTQELSQAYAQVARVVFERADTDGRTALIPEILQLAGHPFLSDRVSLLAALEPLARRDFGNDVAAAVIWAEVTYGVRPDQLRPSPQRLPARDPDRDAATSLQADK